MDGADPEALSGLSERELRRHFQVARLVGVATGILMGTSCLTQSQAEELLHEAARRTGVRLEDVALEVIRRRRLTDT